MKERGFKNGISDIISPMKNRNTKKRVVMIAMDVNVSGHDGAINKKTVAYHKEHAKR